jgi:hypothetical protein
VALEPHSWVSKSLSKSLPGIQIQFRFWKKPAVMDEAIMKSRRPPPRTLTPPPKPSRQKVNPVASRDLDKNNQVL